MKTTKILAGLLIATMMICSNASAQMYSAAHGTKLLLAGAGGGSLPETITLLAPSLAPSTSFSLTLPANVGTAGYVLTTDGTLGHMSWTNLSSMGITSITGVSPIVANTISGATTISLTEGNLTTTSAGISIGGSGKTAGSDITVNLNTGNLTVSGTGLGVTGGTGAVIGSGAQVSLTTGNLTTTGALGVTGGGNTLVGSSSAISLTTDATLTQAGSSLGIDLSHPNLWTGSQTIGSGADFSLNGHSAATGYVLTSQDANGKAIWTNLASLGVTAIKGTQNQVLANATFGSNQVGVVTLTTPQDIATTSSPSFNNLTLTGKATSASTVGGDGGTTLVTKDYVDNSANTAVSGTVNTMAKFTGAHAVGNSGLTENYNNSVAPYAANNAAEQLTATGSDNNISLVLTPKGNGSLQAQMADNGSGGNVRGLNSVDWQISRDASTQVASGDNSVIGGGIKNTSSATGATIGGGTSNHATSIYTTVAGGSANSANNQYATVAGGNGNSSTNLNSTVGGGEANLASGDHSTIDGGFLNIASGAGSFVGGGGTDGLTHPGNTAGGVASVVGGGLGNVANGTYATLGGGQVNIASGAVATVGGGINNKATSTYSTIGGGENNTESGAASVIPGGQGLTISGNGSFGFLGNNSNGNFNMTVAANNTSTFGNTDLWLANNDNSAHSLLFYAPNSTTGAFPGTTKYTGFKAGVQTTSVIYTLPLADGTTGQTLQTDGSGNLSWNNNNAPLLTASNGITRNVNDFELGGPLTGNTDVALAGHNLTISGTGNIAIEQFTNAGVVHNAITTGVLSSSLIVNGDITDATIQNAKLTNSTMTFTSPNSSLTVPGSVALGGNASLDINTGNPNNWSGTQSFGAVIETAAVNADLGSSNVDNYLLGATKTLYQISSDANITLSGMTDGVTGRTVTIVNTGSFFIHLPNAGSSSAGNQFALSDDVYMGPKATVTFVYLGGNWTIVSGF